MKEASYNAVMSAVLVQSYGGKAIKMFNPALLGLPDTLHVKDGITNFIEVKMGEKKSLFRKQGVIFCRPWDAINDIRQYNICKSLNRFAPVTYVIYYPDIRWTAVLPFQIMEVFKDSKHLLKEGSHFVKGHGIGVLTKIFEQRRKMLYGHLDREFRNEAEGVS